MNFSLVIILPLVYYYLTKGLYRYAGILIFYLCAILFIKKKKNINEYLSESNEGKKILIILLLPILYYTLHSLLVSLVFGNSINITSYIKEVLYVLIPITNILLLDFVFDNKSDIIDYIFYSIVIAFILQSVVFNMDYIINNIGNPNRPFGLFENHILTQALVYYFLYYVYKENKRNSIISLLLILLGNKRVVYIGILMCIIPFIILMIKKISVKYKIYLTSIYLVLIQLIYVFCIKINIFQSVMIHLGIDDKWRSNIWGYFLSDFDMGVSFFGKGVGYVYEKLQIIGNEWYPYLYNEPLKYFVELGLLGFIIFSILKLLILFKMRFVNIRYLGFIILSMSFFTSVVFMDSLNFYQEYMFLFFSVIYFSYREYNSENANV